MTQEELEANLTRAIEASNEGNFDFAERLANEVLVHLDTYPAKEWRDGVVLLTRSLLILGYVARVRGNFTDALEHYTAAQAAAETANDVSGIAKAMTGFGNVHDSLGSYDKALEYFAKAIAAFEELGEKLSVAQVTASIGSVYVDLGSYDKALEYFAKAIAAFEELGEKSNVARVTGNIGIVYHFLGSYDKSLEFYVKALSVLDELSEKSSIARITMNIGTVYQSLGSFEKALEYFAKAQSVLDEIGEKSAVATATGNIGSVYLYLGAYDKALEYYEKALAVHEELEVKSSVALDALNIGSTYFELKDYAKALEYQKRALALAEETGDRRLTGGSWYGIGTTLRAMGNKQEALEYLHKALNLRRNELQTNNGVTDNLIDIGVLLAEQNNIDEALERIEEGLALAEELGEKRQASKAHKELAAVNESQGNTVEALKHYKRYHELEKEVVSEEAKKTAQRYQIEREQAEIAVRLQTTEQLLNKTLPPTISKRLMNGEKNIADRFESVSILFADIVGFTPLAARKQPREMVEILNELFSRFDRISERYGVERIKTIGDAYMIVAGAPTILEDHAERMSHVAFAMLDAIDDFNKESTEHIKLRIGISSGDVIGAIVGETKFTYDFWSDAVNTASRMESHGEAGKIHVSDEFKNAVELRPTSKPLDIRFTQRGEVDIKGKGKMRTYFLERTT